MAYYRRRRIYRRRRFYRRRGAYRRGRRFFRKVRALNVRTHVNPVYYNTQGANVLFNNDNNGSVFSSMVDLNYAILALFGKNNSAAMLDQFINLRRFQIRFAFSFKNSAALPINFARHFRIMLIQSPHELTLDDMFIDYNKTLFPPLKAETHLHWRVLKSTTLTLRPGRIANGLVSVPVSRMFSRGRFLLDPVNVDASGQPLLTNHLYMIMLCDSVPGFSSQDSQLVANYRLRLARQGRLAQTSLTDAIAEDLENQGEALDDAVASIKTLEQQSFDRIEHLYSLILQEKEKNDEREKENERERTADRLRLTTLEENQLLLFHRADAADARIALLEEAAKPLEKNLEQIREEIKKVADHAQANGEAITSLQFKELQIQAEILAVGGTAGAALEQATAAEEAATAAGAAAAAASAAAGSAGSSAAAAAAAAEANTLRLEVVDTAVATLTTQLEEHIAQAVGQFAEIMTLITGIDAKATTAAEVSAAVSISVATLETTVVALQDRVSKVEPKVVKNEADISALSKQVPPTEYNINWTWLDNLLSVFYDNDPTKFGYAGYYRWGNGSSEKVYFTSRDIYNKFGQNVNKMMAIIRSICYAWLKCGDSAGWDINGSYSNPLVRCQEWYQ